MKRTLLLLIFISFSFSIPKNMFKKIDKEIKSVFNLESYSKTVIHIEDEISDNLLVPFKDEVFFIILDNNHHIGYFYYGKAKSKVDEFDYLVIFDEELIIKKIKILAYREDYGMEIGSKRWLQQFNDLSIGDQVKYQTNIKAISGATISAKSMTKAINDLLKSLSILQNKKQL